MSTDLGEEYKAIGTSYVMPITIELSSSRFNMKPTPGGLLRSSILWAANQILHICTMTKCVGVYETS
jgi:hypothetical protein